MSALVTLKDNNPSRFFHATICFKTSCFVEIRLHVFSIDKTFSSLEVMDSLIYCYEGYSRGNKQQIRSPTIIKIENK